MPEENQDDFKNKLFINDNLGILNGLNSNSVDLIYLDPPFNSKRCYNAAIGSHAEGSSFKDIWTWQDVNQYQLDIIGADYPELADFIEIIGRINDKSMMSYITYMAQRVIQLHRILKPTGSLYYHCDPTAGHFVKLMLDAIFGKKNFRNEIVWCYGGGGMPKKDFGRKHDLIYRYSKTDDYYFNTQYKPYSEGTLKVPRHSTTSGGEALDLERGTPLTDHWSDLPKLTSYKKSEWVGYPTQKPLALLERIIKTSCPENGIVLDPFCGCATTCVAAEHLGRHWIGIDIEDEAVDILIQRLTDGQIGEGNGLKSVKPNFVKLKNPLARTDVEYKNLKEPQTYKEIKEFLYKKQNHICNGCGKEKYIEDFDIDHIIPKKAGGGDFMENYQLLCHHCNVMKGDKPMEFLLQRVEVIRKMRKYTSFE